MTTEGKDGGTDPQDDEVLWGLLGRGRPPGAVSPYFSRRVLREVAALEDRRAAGWLGRVRQVWALVPRRTALWTGAVAVALLCAAGALTPASVWTTSAPRPTAAVPGMPKGNAVVAESADPAAAVVAAVPEEVSPQDVEVIADLDNLLDREENRLWTEDTARF